MTTRLAVVITAFILLATSPLGAKTIFYGPTPYLSAADSPFDLSGLGTTFRLEDFEDGALNTPGVWVPGLEHHPDAILQPHQGADSVDADDGVIEGFGRGRSLRAFDAFCSGLGCYSSIYFKFDADVLGRYPSYAGIVATDVFIPDSSVGFAAFDPNGIELGDILIEPFGDFGITGQTGEDRFVGVFSSSGISSIFINDSPGGWLEVDHLQYGVVVPEPDSLTLAIFAACYLVRGMLSAFS